ncbi:protein MLN51 homolog isoform X1 [Dendrobium catenatum]|uniref:Btz domain-containing protein n=1 Tax=Dendrobium catenatum TaxID=906689 RepID=A0A2I0WVU9_9ASPA|nr:protein MLN51 homolog isoform X1 [Dendrobium catenatum]XP_028550758.1 protein MLN51 homolog isoform X1 [Dendrobium catenatum]PKU79782.1 hypothetical protein MA16_Dca026053 [Dendrobium catenatum]
MADCEDVEYDSDPEDSLRPSMMRRREASDDEDGEGSCGEGGSKPVRKDRLDIRSDDELEGEGGAPGYDDEEYEEQEEEEMIGEEVEEEDMEGEDEVEVLERATLEGGRSRDVGEFDGSSVLPEESGLRSGGEMGGYKEKNPGEEEEKKESEPFSVPTAGAFYMHDDRFEENGRGRHRRMPGGRRLWESKDDQAWVHDRFEEMNLQDRRHEERRMPRGHFRVRSSGRGRGVGRCYGRGNRMRAYYDEKSNQNCASKSVRGRGPVRYEPLSSSSEVSPNQSKQHRKAQEPTSNNTAAKKFSQSSDAPPEAIAPRKQAFASSLSSASPPFYPSGSSNQEMAAIQKHDVQTGSNNKPLSSTAQIESFFSIKQPNSLFRGKTVIDSVCFDRLHVDDSVPQASGKALVHTQVQASRSSLSLSNANKSPPYKVQGKNSTTISMPSYPTSFNQVGRIPLQNQPTVIHQKPVQSQGQPLRVSNQHLVIGSQVPSSPQASVGISSDVEEAESLADMSKSNSTLVGKGKIVNQGADRGSFLYGGAQVIGPTGAVGLPHGDPNFAGTPALLPVMQFGGQHPGGIRVPAVGMALPGYVAQPGFGNSEMTWVPVLAGAAGALGASYCSPYIALDGTYYARPSGQASASVSSIKETGGAKPANALKPPQKNEFVNDEFGQRQNKPRRYSEMNFGQ